MLGLLLWVARELEVIQLRNQLSAMNRHSPSP